MTKNAKIGAALVGGYLLGRTKKAKLAVGFGMFLLGKKFDLDPKRIGRMLAESPALGPLNDQVRKELVDATRTAATKAVTQRAGSLAESLQRRTQSLEAGPGAEDEEPFEDPDDAEDPRASDDDGDENGTDRDEEPKRGGSARKPAASARKAAPKTRRASGGSRSASAGKAAAPARKRTGGAAKAAASGTRKARGGGNA